MLIFGIKLRHSGDFSLFLFENRISVLENNPIATSPEEQFVVGESDFDYFKNHASRCENGAILFCRKGNARATVNQSVGSIRRDTLVLILPGTILMFDEMSSDFRMMFCSFSRDLFAEAAFRLDPAFFRVLLENPITHATTRIADGAAIWFQMAAYTYRDRDNTFRNMIIRNRLQNVLMEIYDKLQRFSKVNYSISDSSSRQVELFHRFVALVHESSSREREVAYYADKLCISTRYLSTIVRNITHSTAKEFIDRSVLMEIKILLQSADMSVQEIADRLHFPDQSYFGRYFKKHTGASPTEYRATMK